MHAVRNDRTDIEQALAQEMWALGLRGWRRGRRTEGARPDFAFVNARVAVFVDGCFWHGCPVCGKAPVHNKGYWDAKFERNRARDGAQTVTLRKAGWTVIRFWGHEIEADPSCCAAVVLTATRNSSARAR